MGDSNQNVFGLLPVIPSLPDKTVVSCLESWAHFVYVGATDGHILLYRVSKKATDEGESFDALLLARESAGHGRKPVTQLHALADSGKLVSLCGESMSHCAAHVVPSLLFCCACAFARDCDSCRSVVTNNGLCR